MESIARRIEPLLENMIVLAYHSQVDRDCILAGLRKEELAVSELHAAIILLDLVRIAELSKTSRKSLGELLGIADGTWRRWWQHGVPTCQAPALKAQLRKILLPETT